MSLRPGEALGRYLIEGVLGQGGMGSVYRAHDGRLHRSVALKVLAAPGSSGGAGRILREARIAAKLEHPNVVAIYDVEEIAEGDHAGTAYLAMELVVGRSLRACIGDATIPLATRVRWLGDVARGLAAAHDRGLVHRDVKPENVIVRADGVTKVLDFGIAKHVGVPARAIAAGAEAITRDGALGVVMPVAAEDALAREAPIHAPSITGEGIVIGTPYYMSPEQMKGLTVDARSDQFSWAVMAYELLCGRPPWGTDVAPVHVVASVLGVEPADPREANPEVPAWLAALLLRAMSKAVTERFASMHEVVARLEAGADVDRALPESPRGAPLHARSRSALRLGAGVLLSVAAAALAVFALRAAPRTASSVSASVAPTQPSGCVSNAACTASLETPSVCVAGRCASLASPDCHVAADPALLAREDTLWIGSLYPETGNVATMGKPNERATELAQQDFAQASALSAGGDHVRPIGLVACDDGTNAERAARHLVEELQVPAVLGFRNGDELLALSGSLLGPHHTLVVATLTTSPLVTQVPHAADEPPLVWRTTHSLSESAEAIGRLLADVVEPGLRAEGAATTRVVLLRRKTPSLLAFSERLFDTLRYNGKSALENGADFREFAVDWDSASPETYRSIVAKLLDIQPTVILYTGSPFIDTVIEPLEKQWPASARVRPRYVTPVVFDDPLFPVVGVNRDLRRRMFGFTLPSTTAVNGRYTLHYNGVYGTDVSRADAPSSAYDGFYLVAYAALALGGAPATGPSLARAVGRLVSGPPVEVGPSGIYQAFSHLRAGESIDLLGAGGPLDLDLATGENRTDLSVLCLDVDKNGKATGSLESGLVFEARSRALAGKMRCP
jgi:serine/threonine-protein kinase